MKSNLRKVKVNLAHLCPTSPYLAHFRTSASATFPTFVVIIAPLWAILQREYVTGRTYINNNNRFRVMRRSRKSHFKQTYPA